MLLVSPNYILFFKMEYLPVIILFFSSDLCVPEKDASYHALFPLLFYYSLRPTFVLTSSKMLPTKHGS